ncbi:MarR family winged helix-turn-helix transcriptional regulator [Acetobacterium wieringae]|uniref:MarR family winged helix-turn-helix transcriptional regulator n=1 Tax=Acetobacterium wieringae TaxID=52694 RepID=A0ABY6HGV6_9FIRM|nr:MULTISPECIES: MarR family winged helix-turn-helix transcriptional regulator [Acetobacterium]UYO63129.1 MarR family winged helix-turn-helix transcriptional regulator [Acetobacterium wieringae]
MNLNGHDLFKAFHRIKKSSMGRIHKEFMQDLKPHEFFMLKTLKKMYDEEQKTALTNNLPLAPGVKISQLSRETAISMPGVSQTISTLEKHGYVERIASSKDRRLVYVNLTAAGLQLETDVSKSCFQIYDEAATLLGEEDAQALVLLLDKLAVAFDQIDQKQCGLKQKDQAERKTT